jgi:hypothetical protein
LEKKPRISPLRSPDFLLKLDFLQVPVEIPRIDGISSRETLVYSSKCCKLHRNQEVHLMSLVFDRLLGGGLRKLAFFLCVTSPLLVRAQGLTSPGSADNPFATDTSNSLSGFSAARSFGPYSGEKRQDRVPAAQEDSPDTFNWTQLFKNAAQTATRFAAPRLFTNSGPGQMGGGGSLFHAGSSFSETSGDSFNMSSRGVDFSTKSPGFDLRLSVRTMFPNGFSQTGGGSSFAGSGLSGSPDGGLGSLGTLGGVGGRDAGKGSGARVSLQLKF